MRHTRTSAFAVALVILGNVLCAHISYSNALPVLDEWESDTLRDRSMCSFFDALNTFAVKADYDAGYTVYLKELFADYWKDLFDSSFVHATQNELKCITDDEEQLYNQMDSMFRNSCVMRLLCRAIVTWCSDQVHGNKPAPNEALLGQYLANMPSVLKQKLCFAQIHEALWGEQNKRHTYFARSRYAFCAMLANTLTLRDHIDLLSHLEKMRQEVRAGIWNLEGISEKDKIASIDRLRHLFYQALGEGQRYKVALYFYLKKKCDDPDHAIAEPCKFQRFCSTGASQLTSNGDLFDNDGQNKVVRDVSASPEKNIRFLPTTPVQMLEKAYMNRQSVIVSYRTLMEGLCPDVMEALQHDSELCALFFRANARRCAGNLGLSPRGTNVIQQGNGEASQNSSKYGALERIFDVEVKVTAGTQMALRVPHLHENPLITKDLQQKWPQEIDRILHLKKQYPENDLAVVHAATKAHAIALKVLCDAEYVPKDIETLILKFMFPQWGLDVKSCPGKRDSAYITSDGIRDLLSDHDETSSAQKKLPTFERMRPSDVFRLFSSHYDLSDKRAAIVVPKEAMLQ